MTQNDIDWTLSQDESKHVKRIMKRVKKLNPDADLQAVEMDIIATHTHFARITNPNEEKQ